MQVIPAIDLIGGKCVRLTMGRYSEVEEYADDPGSAARRWEEEGAELIHIVDLEGAKAGDIKNAAAVEAITCSVDVETELGGGIRSMEAVRHVLDDLGVSRAILGTAALRDPDFLAEAVEKFGSRIVVSVDARGGMVATEGWLETSRTPAWELAQRIDPLGFAEFIYTEIGRDGMLSGPDTDAVMDFARRVRHGVIAAGGISSVDDIRGLASLSVDNLSGAIVGKALYRGLVSLPEAIAAVR